MIEIDKGLLKVLTAAQEYVVLAASHLLLEDPQPIDSVRHIDPVLATASQNRELLLVHFLFPNLDHEQCDLLVKLNLLVWGARDQGEKARASQGDYERSQAENKAADCRAEIKNIRRVVDESLLPVLTALQMQILDTSFFNPDANDNVRT